MRTCQRGFYCGHMGGDQLSLNVGEQCGRSGGREARADARVLGARPAGKGECLRGSSREKVWLEVGAGGASPGMSLRREDSVTAPGRGRARGPPDSVSSQSLFWAQARLFLESPGSMSENQSPRASK